MSRPRLLGPLGAYVEGSTAPVSGSTGQTTWAGLASGQLSDAQVRGLSGLAVILSVIEQEVAAGIILQLDGSVRRMVLVPPDVPREHIHFIVDTAEADAVVSDTSVVFTGRSRDAGVVQNDQVQTEWVLLTSGTTGPPKLVSHTLTSLAAAVGTQEHEGHSRIVWSTFYDIRRYGGLQIFLRAALTGCALVFSCPNESPARFLARLREARVTHISGTPSHWRRALMSDAAALIAPKYVRLSGEIADQGILNRLRAQYPEAHLVHAFASTEGGVGFVVSDGASGVPAAIIGDRNGVMLKIEGGTLRIRSSGCALKYLGAETPLRDHDGFVDTGDTLELRDGRFHFMGRLDGTINVGGAKLHPEEVERVINAHPDVRMSLVSARKNSIMGSVTVADAVLCGSPTDEDQGKIRNAVLMACRRELAPYKVPAVLTFVPALEVSASGKLVRPYA